MKLRDMFSIVDLANALEDGYVRKQSHPTEPLAILNYTDKSAWESHWDDVTLACRGLIYNTTTMDVVARPFDKFFNYEELPPGSIDLTSHVEVTDKMDGSLGILYKASDGWAIATRGSFASAQAVWATSWFRKYANFDYFNPEYTYLFEIVASWNRIVLSYDWEGLVLIGIIDKETGRDIDLPEDSRLLQAGTPRDDPREYKD